MLNTQAAARRDPRQIPHGGLRIPINHLRHHIPRRHNRRSKPDSKIRRGTKRRGTSQRHGQHRLLPIAGHQRRPGRRMIRRRVLLGILPQLPRIHITQPGNHRRLMPARPIRAARRQHHRHRIREGIRQLHPTLEQKIDRSIIKPGQQLLDRLINPRNPRNRGNTRNNRHLIRVIPLILRLPQRIRPPPTTHILVNHRHKIYRLTRGFRQLQEPGRIRRVHQIRCPRIQLAQPSHNSRRIIRH